MTKTPSTFRAYAARVGSIEETGIYFAHSPGQVRGWVVADLRQLDYQVSTALPDGGRTPWRFYEITDVRVRRAPAYDALAQAAALAGKRGWTKDYCDQLLSTAQQAAK